MSDEQSKEYHPIAHYLRGHGRLKITKLVHFSIVKLESIFMTYLMELNHSSQWLQHEMIDGSRIDKVLDLALVFLGPDTYKSDWEA